MTKAEGGGKKTSLCILQKNIFENVGSASKAGYVLSIQEFQLKAVQINRCCISPFTAKEI